MGSISANIEAIRRQLPAHVTLVVVSKTKPVEMLLEAYAAGQRDFGENYVQELEGKVSAMPSDIKWHFIGHLQSNKVKFIAPFVHLIHAVDSIKLLQEIQKQAVKNNRVIDVLLQVHVASEETKFGWAPEELSAQSTELFGFSHVRIRGLMAMASNTDDTAQIESEFERVNTIFTILRDKHPDEAGVMDVLSMGMSSDWALAVKHGSTMIRLGSTIFGSRQATQ